MGRVGFELEDINRLSYSQMPLTAQPSTRRYLRIKAYTFILNR